MFFSQTAQPTCSKVYNAGVGGEELRRVLGERVDSGSLIELMHVDNYSSKSA